jgi:hypothetical protein
MREKPTNTSIIHLVYQLCMVATTCFGITLHAHAHHVTRHNTPVHNILSTTPQFSISQKALETHPEDGNEMPKHTGKKTKIDCLCLHWRQNAFCEVGDNFLYIPAIFINIRLPKGL